MKRIGPTLMILTMATAMATEGESCEEQHNSLVLEIRDATGAVIATQDTTTIVQLGSPQEVNLAMVACWEGEPTLSKSLLELPFWTGDMWSYWGAYAVTYPDWEVGSTIALEATDDAWDFPTLTISCEGSEDLTGDVVDVVFATDESVGAMA
jgi:hypothetical protein